MKSNVIGLLAVFALSFFPIIAQGSCNSMPGASDLSSPRSDGSQFKGALGGINHSLVTPGVSRAIAVTADGVCVGDKDRELRFADPQQNAYVVVLLNAQDDDASIRYPLVLSSFAGGCGSVRTPMSEAYSDRWHCREPGAGAELTAAVVPAPHANANTIGFSLATLPPDFDEVAARSEGSTGLSLGEGAMTIFATNNAAGIATLARALETTACADLCSTLADQGAFACLDTFFSGSPTTTFSLSSIACNLTQLPNSLKTTKFKDQCDDRSGNSPLLPKCPSPNPGPHKMDIYVDDCGNLKIPMDFTDLLANPGDERLISGKSAVSRFAEGDPRLDQQLWVPGREFIGSTPFNDPFGTQGSNWHLPKIEVFWENNSQAFGIRGLVDKPGEHIVHVVPRLPVTLRCEGGVEEACEKTEELFGVVQTACACSDTHAASCTCKPPLPAGQEMYFACQGGGVRDGMPCTRSAHCFPGGTCTRQPRCQKPEEAVFSENLPGGGGSACWYDSMCSVGNKTQCGYDLFDFRPRGKSKNNIVTLDSKVKKNIQPNRRGICKGSLGTICNNTNVDTQCTAANDECAGYSLIAEGVPGP